MKLLHTRYPRHLVQVPRSEWPWDDPAISEVWMSRSHLVQVRPQREGLALLSICRTTKATDGRWHDGISWDDLQALKGQCGRGPLDAVEVYPPDEDVVNVANMRHLWVFDTPLDFPWRTVRRVT